MENPEVAARAKSLGIRSVPAVVIDGALVSCLCRARPGRSSSKSRRVGHARLILRRSSIPDGEADFLPKHIGPFFLRFYPKETRLLPLIWSIPFFNPQQAKKAVSPEFPCKNLFPLATKGQKRQ
jgi:hypothetical protein